MHEKITTVGGGNEAVWNTVKEEERSKTSCGPSCGVPELPPTEKGRRRRALTSQVGVQGCSKKKKAALKEKHSWAFLLQALLSRLREQPE
jgi:hypothetical protein